MTRADDKDRRVTASETTMVRAALRAGFLVAIVMMAVFALLSGTAAALTALGGVSFVTAMFAVTGRSLGWAADRSPTVVQGVALGGFFLRLVLYAALIVVLRPVEAIDGTALAVSAAVAMVAILALETRLVLTHREFWFVDAAARPLADRKERV